MTEEQSQKLMEEVHKLNPSSIVELYELDARPAGDDSVLYFHDGSLGIKGESNQKTGQYDSVRFKGQAYIPMPVQVSGFEAANSGEPPRPILKIANVMSMFSSLNTKTDDLCGAILTRRRTFAKYLDGMPDAAPIEYPPDIYTIEQKTEENRLYVTYELGSGMDLDGQNFPIWAVTAGFCRHTYRGTGCNFGGTYYVADIDNSLFTPFFRLEGGKMTYTFRGVWDFSVSNGYTVGQTVSFTDPSTFDYGVYQCIADTPAPIPYSQNPSNPAFWTRVQRYRKEYNATVVDYVYGDVVHVMQKDGSKEYFLCIWIGTQDLPTVPVGVAPPETTYWSRDNCAKSLKACTYRFDPFGSGAELPFGGFPGVLNLPEV